MSTRNRFAKGALMAAAGVMAFSAAVAAPTFAAAQSGPGYYDSQSSTYYDPCQRDQTNRATFGGILGALAGAAIGSNLAAHHGGRMGGAALGGVAGAVGGAAIGKSSAACNSGGPPPPRTSYYRDQQQPYYREGAYAPRDYDDRDDHVSVVEDTPAPSADRCTLAESPIYLPDGRVQKRFVRVCRDSTGRYQVVE